MPDKATYEERAIQVALVAQANGITLDPLRYIDLLDRARERDRWERERDNAR